MHRTLHPVGGSAPSSHLHKVPNLLCYKKSGESAVPYVHAICIWDTERAYLCVVLRSSYWKCIQVGFRVSTWCFLHLRAVLQSLFPLMSINCLTNYIWLPAITVLLFVVPRNVSSEVDVDVPLTLSTQVGKDSGLTGPPSVPKNSCWPSLISGV
jgi:hypothetical protein